MRASKTDAYHEDETRERMTALELVSDKTLVSAAEPIELRVNASQ
jgi:hypothetical protein